MDQSLRFRRFSTNKQKYLTLRVVRVRTFNDLFVGNKYRYELILTNMDGESLLSKFFRTHIHSVEECVLSDLNNILWRKNLSVIRGIKRNYLFRVKRPSWAISVSGRTYDYGVGSIWTDGSIVTDNEYINMVGRTEGRNNIEFIELE